MSSLNRRALGALILALPASAALAHHDVTKGDLVIGHPWTRAAGANTNGAGFMTLKNNGSAPDRLISAASPAARVVELHTHIREGDVMRMRPVADIPIPPGQTVHLRPGGLHIMLIGLTEPLRQGATVPLTLRFERAGEVQVTLGVESAGARGHAH
ncbi:MAG: copper chaperone PCu(A)C [Roseomonas sp.]|jgi:copper(I)-binding protein|nr:copper chaperone PCu(A)C [Roseomonas sp.]MCA3292624.1 copper chaperone PCu(A)C [Roseomonas sp.]MCA3296041.1 copper chaperone PCu(A)C [Roseomonas sp.]